MFRNTSPMMLFALTILFCLLGLAGWQAVVSFGVKNTAIATAILITGGLFLFLHFAPLVELCPQCKTANRIAKDKSGYLPVFILCRNCSRRFDSSNETQALDVPAER